MDTYRHIYEFAASAGAFEGYVYRKEAGDLEPVALSRWTANLQQAYELLPPDARRAIQPGVDQTFGRAVRSLEQILAGDHPLIGALRDMIVGDLPVHPDDFKTVKWFHK